MRIFDPRPLKKWMERRSIDVNQMAEMIQMDKLTVKNILGGRVDPRLGTMAAIHRVTKIPYDMMIRGDGK
jgi:transcriptional regulator with XRE-family HTH domain